MNRKEIIDGLLQRHFGISIDDTNLEDCIPDTCVAPFEEVNSVYDSLDLDRIDLNSMYPPFTPLTLEDQNAIIEGWEIREARP